MFFQNQTLPFKAKSVSKQLSWLPVCSSGLIILTMRKGQDVKMISTRPFPEAGLSFELSAECCHSERAQFNRDNLRDPQHSEGGGVVFFN